MRHAAKETLGKWHPPENPRKGNLISEPQGAALKKLGMPLGEQQTIPWWGRNGLSPLTIPAKMVVRTAKIYQLNDPVGRIVRTLQEWVGHGQREGIFRFTRLKRGGRRTMDEKRDAH